MKHVAIPFNSEFLVVKDDLKHAEINSTSLIYSLLDKFIMAS